MTLTARIDAAVHVQARLAAYHRQIDVDWLARNAEYALEVRQLCLAVPDASMEMCLRLLDALVDAILLAELPPADNGVRLSDFHPAFADTLSDPG
ncbi:hypothetical protein [Piscinibacter gummiphilus]|uniref:Uncharacterized protein n=1 Tax=Piscinibacter gummiphilus TaxID=946333 RepID=A0A1W6L842_9BURK|nr:hypothetical protein [Piscinibacter gummiphilus]ARN20387.1 hypothetical protein A4W93_11010 [Piscinibacter gummiphilus]ATU65060.1 hypothetical protein CPZ87_11080 [Piscinibacter gummiphilus]GLS98556.1 hypothetical protein GCM10007918_58480 [Piscinibacter gummiphilus]